MEVAGFPIYVRSHPDTKHRGRLDNFLGISIDGIMAKTPLKRDEDVDLRVEGFRNAGVPEH